MSDGQADDRFDAFLEREAPAYHRPPAAVPRDAMWEVIARARTTRRRPRRYAPWIGMAATLLLGIGLGRYALDRTPAAPVAAAPLPAGAAPGVDTGSPGVTGEQDAATGGERPGASSPGAGPARPAAGTALASGDSAGARRSVPMGVVAGATPQRPNPSTRASVNGDAGDGGYAVASRALLTRAEALVAVVSTMPADATMDSLTGRWARDVLTNTRLLLDSPAGADPVRRRLLEDLETLLVQLVQRSGRAAEERDMIDRTLQRTQLLTRLRSGATGT